MDNFSVYGDFPGMPSNCVTLVIVGKNFLRFRLVLKKRLRETFQQTRNPNPGMRRGFHFKILCRKDIGITLL